MYFCVRTSFFLSCVCLCVCFSRKKKVSQIKSIKLKFIKFPNTISNSLTITKFTILRKHDNIASNEVFNLWLQRSSIKVKWSFQLPLKSKSQVLNKSLKVQIVLLDCPYVWGWHAVLKFNLEPKAFLQAIPEPRSESQIFLRYN